MGGGGPAGPPEHHRRSREYPRALTGARLVLTMYPIGYQRAPNPPPNGQPLTRGEGLPILAPARQWGRREKRRPHLRWLTGQLGRVDRGVRRLVLPGVVGAVIRVISRLRDSQGRRAVGLDVHVERAILGGNRVRGNVLVLDGDRFTDLHGEDTGVVLQILDGDRLACGLGPRLVVRSDADRGEGQPEDGYKGDDQFRQYAHLARYSRFGADHASPNSAGTQRGHVLPPRPVMSAGPFECAASWWVEQSPLDRWGTMAQQTEVGPAAELVFGVVAGAGPRGGEKPRG